MNPSSKALPGGVSSGARALGLLDGRDFIVASSNGAHLTDTYGSTFVDYGMAMGANLLGHAHPVVVEACTAALASGSMPGFSNDLEWRAAEALVRIGGERVNRMTFTTTGTEAVQLAIRAARGKTGRELVAKSVGGYDGWVDNVRFGLVQSPEAARTNARPVQLDVTLLRVNDLADLETLFAEYGNELAAILLEPILGNTACLLPSPEWIALLNALCAQYGVMIISDEVMAGMRCGFGLVADVIGLKADYISMGKAIGSGIPVAALLGTEDAFSVFEDSSVPRFGTYHGNPLASAAVIATTDFLSRADYQAELFDYGARLRSGIVKAYAAEGLTVCTAGFDAVFSLWFCDKPPHDYDEALLRLNPEATRINYEALRRYGVIALPSPWGRYFNSFSHDEADLEATLTAFAAAAAEVARAKCV